MLTKDGQAPAWQALVADDEPAVLGLVATLLRQDGFAVSGCEDGHVAVDLARQLEPDLIVLDVDLPSLDGVEACRRIRAFSEGYVILLTALQSEDDKLAGFAAGCDDYVAKPFSGPELIARARAGLRRLRAASAADDGIRRFGRLSIDPRAREVLVGGRRAELTRTEFDLLEALSGSPRLAFSRRRLIEEVWGADWFGDDHLVDVHVSNLRRKLGDDAKRYITTVRGIGYRMGPGA